MKRTSETKIMAIITLVAVIAALVYADIPGMIRNWRPQAWQETVQQKETGLPWATISMRDVEARTGPGFNYEPVIRLPYGTAVEVIGHKNGWVECLRWECADPIWVWGEQVDMMR